MVHGCLGRFTTAWHISVPRKRVGNEHISLVLKLDHSASVYHPELYKKPRQAYVSNWNYRHSQ